MEVESVGTFPDKLVKLVTPPLSPQTKLNFEQNGWKWVLFLATTLLGKGGGGEQGDKTMNPKPIKKLSWRAESYITITWKGFFFTPSQVLLSSIVGHHLCTRIWVSTMIGMLKKTPLFNCQSGWKEIGNAFPIIRWIHWGPTTGISVQLCRRYWTEVKLRLWRRL